MSQNTPQNNPGSPDEKPKRTDREPTPSRLLDGITLLYKLAVDQSAKIDQLVMQGESMRGDIAELHETIESLQAHLATPATQPVGVISGTGGVVSSPYTSPHGMTEFLATELVVTIGEDGEPAYKLKGFPFVKFGVRVWPEVLPLLGVDPDKLKPGKNPFSGVVRALLNEEGKPKKVVALVSQPGSPQTEPV